jgi:hypothetical protein
MKSRARVSISLLAVGCFLLVGLAISIRQTSQEGGGSNASAPASASSCVNETQYTYADEPEYVEPNEEAAIAFAAEERRKEAEPLRASGDPLDAYEGYEAQVAAARVQLYTDLERRTSESSDGRAVWVSTSNGREQGRITIEQGADPSSGWMVTHEVVTLPDIVCDRLERRRG